MYICVYVYMYIAARKGAEREAEAACRALHDAKVIIFKYRRSFISSPLWTPRFPNFEPTLDALSLRSDVTGSPYQPQTPLLNPQPPARALHGAKVLSSPIFLC